MENKSFKSTPIPHRSTLGTPMRYVIIDENGIDRPVTRVECLTPGDEPSEQNPYTQRWFVDEESGLVARLTRNEMGENLARDNMRYIWREAKREERWSKRVVSPSVDEDGAESVHDVADESKESNVEGIVIEKSLLDTLNSALADLTQMDRDIINGIFKHGKTERQLAPELGFKQSKSVNDHKQKALALLRENPGLKSFFEYKRLRADVRVGVREG